MNNNDNELKSTLVDLTNILSELKVSYHLTGGLAASFYGEPRFTQDIDLVIKINRGKNLQLLTEALAKRFIIDVDSIRDDINSNQMFQALHEESMIKIDFYVGEAIPNELERSQLKEILPGIVIPIVAVEDIILAKLIWIQKGSAKSRQDIKSIMRLQKSLDLEYLSSQALNLGVKHILSELESEV
jgi:hypothetical protein